MQKRARAVRWGVPIAAVAVVAAAAGTGPVIAAVQGEPSLPDRTAEQLLADAARSSQTGKVPPMSGTVVETASLGLPALPGVSSGGSSPLALLSGSHQLKVWYGDAGRIRLMLPGEMSETDLIVNGGQAWLWDSAAGTATRLKTGEAGGPATPTSLPTSLRSAGTPQQAARDALKAAEGNTAISVDNDLTVAGRAAYQLVLTPKAAGSLVRDVRLALDGETLIPLRVQVYAKGATEPAFEVGFESVTFSPPAPENFEFTPPPGAKVEDGAVSSPDKSQAETTAGKDVTAAGKAARVVGEGWESVLVTPFPAAAAKGKDAGGAGDAGNVRGFEGADGAGAGALLDAALKAATPVSGTWGSGRLLRTKLVSALVTDDGRLVAGAVTPDVLYRAAGAHS